MVGLPFVDSLVRGLLLAADPYRSVVTGDTQVVSPRAIRAAVEIIEEEAHLPLTVSSIAGRCHVSVRSLQQDFRRYVEVSPMAFCVRFGCVGHIRICLNPTPRRRVSLRLPTSGALPTSAGSLPRTRPATTSPRRRHCGAGFLCEPNRMSDMPGEVPGQLLQNEARAHNRVTSVRRGSTVKRQRAVTVAEAGCQRCSS